MPADLTILKVAGALARHGAERHSLIAVNVANADTPGFRARDLESFQQAYRRQQTAPNGADARTRAVETLGIASPNGNTVSLEDQMMRAGEAARASDIATTIFAKTIAMLRAAAARPR